MIRDHLGMVGEVEYGRRGGSVINAPRASIQRPRSLFVAVMNHDRDDMDNYDYHDKVLSCYCVRDHLAMVGQIQYKKTSQGEEPHHQVGHDENNAAINDDIHSRRRTTSPFTMLRYFCFLQII